MTSHGFEIPETIFAFSVPVLPARDVDASLAFFESVLGFRRAFAHGSPTQYAGMRRDGAEIHFYRCDDSHMLENSGCRVRVDGIDALYARCLNRGVVHPDGKLAQKPWGQREFVMLDPDGVMLTFFQPQQPRSPGGVRLPPRAEPMAASPCIAVCRLDPGTRLCIGCGRSVDEIAQWPDLDEAARQRILDRLRISVTAPARPVVPLR